MAEGRSVMGKTDSKRMVGYEVWKGRLHQALRSRSNQKKYDLNVLRANEVCTCATEWKTHGQCLTWTCNRWLSLGPLIAWITLWSPFSSCCKSTEGLVWGRSGHNPGRFWAAYSAWFQDIKPSNAFHLYSLLAVDANPISPIGLAAKSTGFSEFRRFN